MGNLTYLAVTILKRDKRTILNAIMMLFCFCGINLIMLLYKICGLAKEFSNAPYIERLMEVFSLLVIIMFIATIIVLLLGDAGQHQRQFQFLPAAKVHRLY